MGRIRTENVTREGVQVDVGSLSPLTLILPLVVIESPDWVGRVRDPWLDRYFQPFQQGKGHGPGLKGGTKPLVESVFSGVFYFYF